jgi:hypothetical protein
MLAHPRISKSDTKDGADWSDLLCDDAVVILSFNRDVDVIEVGSFQIRAHFGRSVLPIRSLTDERYPPFNSQYDRLDETGVRRSR